MDIWAFGVFLYEILSPAGTLSPQVTKSTAEQSDLEAFVAERESSNIDSELFADWGAPIDPLEATPRELIRKLLVPHSERPNAKELVQHLSSFGFE